MRTLAVATRHSSSKSLRRSLGSGRIVRRAVDVDAEFGRLVVVFAVAPAVDHHLDLRSVLRVRVVLPADGDLLFLLGLEREVRPVDSILLVFVLLVFERDLYLLAGLV